MENRVHLLHTVNEHGHQDSKSPCTIQLANTHSTGGFDEENWALLQTSGLPLPMLAKPTGPIVGQKQGGIVIGW